MKRNSLKLKRLGLFIPEVQKDKLQKISEEIGLSLSEMVRRALDDYIEKNRKIDVP